MWRLQSRETLVQRTGILKLVDFGLTKSIAFDKDGHFDLQSKTNKAPSGDTTAYLYVAPEVLRHELYDYKVRRDLRTDISPLDGA